MQSNPLPLQHEVHPGRRDVREDERIQPEDLKKAQDVLLGVMRCKWATDMERDILKTLDKPVRTDPASLTADAQEEQITSLQYHLSKVVAVRKDCADMPAEELDKQARDKLLAAARLGDENAARCYIIDPLEAPSLQADPAAFEEYNRNAADLIQRGMEAGDWNMVYLLEVGTRNDVGLSRSFNSLFVHDGLTSYRYKKLRRLGTVSDEAEELDMQLEEQAKRLVENGKAAPDDIRKADQWAQETYRTYFATTEPLARSPKLCNDPTGGLQEMRM